MVTRHRALEAAPVTVSIPYFGAGPLIRRAVTSILRQEHRALTVIVLNDGDRVQPPWPYLRDIDDPRLVRFDLRSNRGPYFAHAVALEATDDPLFLVQDADDWSATDRLAVLLEQMHQDGSDWVSSGVALHQSVDTGGDVLYSFRFCAPVEDLTGRCVHRIGHHALFRTDVLKRLGGYYGGFRIGYDTLLTNLCLMAFRASHVPVPLYHSLKWQHSLTHNERTGFGSPQRVAARKQIDHLYHRAFGTYLEYVAGRLSADSLLSSLMMITQQSVDPVDRSNLLSEAASLRGMLRSTAPAARGLRRS